MIPETCRLDRGGLSRAGALACGCRKVAGLATESCRVTETFPAVTRTTIRDAVTFRCGDAKSPPDHEPGPATGRDLPLNRDLPPARAWRAAGTDSVARSVGRYVEQVLLGQQLVQPGLVDPAD